VFLADGSAASGTLIISWPAFVTAGGNAVAAGSTNVALGANGALNVSLVPNSGATPAGVYYSVVYQLGPGQVKTEYWIVPTTSPAKLSAVRSTPGAGLAAQPVSLQYVNSEQATKADDTSVVHLNGAETISGNKTFASPPTVPAPASAGQIANKAYVDQAITNVGAGSYLSTAGGTVTGPITLPGNPATMVAPATVLYDGLMANAPGFCNYTLVNAATMHCTIAYTYVTRISLAEVRTALPNSEYVTEPVGTLTDGGTCAIVSSTTLDFYPQYVPPVKTLIVASYRGRGRAVPEVMNAENIATLANGNDDGVRGEVRMLEFPNARTQIDCENAALAMLEDAGEPAWSGSYQVWSTFLPGGATDIFPGDALAIHVPSQGADFGAIVRKVEIEMVDPAGDCGFYSIEFANDAAEPLAYEDATSAGVVPLQDVPTRLVTSEVGTYYLPSLTQAQINLVTSTTVQVDAGMVPPSGCGIEVRAHDFGWGSANERNLLGRFGSKTFTLPRLARTQNYFLRLYDSSSPARYSRYAAALHVDYPL